ncbi:MAG: trypsin-like peptidase domain-containing protein [Leptospirales bacterium]|nr:trypsin-like peptidase domain-containing protein [Leptospirales bacterium]
MRNTAPSTLSRIIFLSLLLGGLNAASLLAQSTPPAHLHPPEGVSQSDFERAYRESQALQTVFRAIHDSVGPSVVSIVTAGGGQRSFGTGFIIDAAGIIVTNRHVVGGSRNVRVVLNDRREVNGVVLGADARSDVAVIRVSGEQNLKAAVIGDSDRMRVGDVAIAVGSPFGLDGTFTTGVISAVRSAVDDTGRKLIQTDASINQGNSGGPLLNLRGEVVGINQMIYSPTGGNVGIGFAIPINQVRPIIQRIVEGRPNQNNDSQRPQLGVWVEPAPGGGAIVSQVIVGSPAERAGIEPGDRIMKADNAAVNGPQELVQLIQSKKAGDAIVLEVQRNDQRVRIRVVLGAPQ